jgi:hypothetical protein
LTTVPASIAIHASEIRNTRCGSGSTAITTPVYATKLRCAAMPRKRPCGCFQFAISATLVSTWRSRPASTGVLVERLAVVR